MRTVVRRPNKTKAALSLGAAVAVLIGGASTFARWAGDADLILTDHSPATIKAGEWEFKDVSLPITDLAWYDSSKEVQSTTYAAIYASGRLHNNTNNTRYYAVGTGDGDYLPIPPTGTAQTTPTEGGLKLTGNDLTQFAIVPGDQLTGIFCIDESTLDLSDSKLVGEHLRVEVDSVAGTTTGEASNNPIFDDTGTNWGDAVKANAYTAKTAAGANTPWASVLADGTGDPGDCALGQKKVAVVIDYEYNLATDDLAKMKVDYCKSHNGLWDGSACVVPVGTCSGGTWAGTNPVTKAACFSGGGTGWVVTTNVTGETMPITNGVDDLLQPILQIKGLSVTLHQTR